MDFSNLTKYLFPKSGAIVTLISEPGEDGLVSVRKLDGKTMLVPFASLQVQKEMDSRGIKPPQTMADAFQLGLKLADLRREL